MTQANTQGASAPSVDRTTASQLNPLISACWTEDTLDAAAAVVTDMGYLLSQVATPPEGAELHFGRLYLFCEVIAAALAYEKGNIRSAAQARKERSHV